MLGGGGYQSMRELVKSAKQTRQSKWKENAQYDPRSGHWFDKTTGEPVTPGGSHSVVDGTAYEPFEHMS